MLDPRVASLGWNFECMTFLQLISPTKTAIRDKCNNETEARPSHLGVHLGRAAVLAISLFEIPDYRKQSKCLQIGNKVNKLWYMHTMENYTALKKR